MRATLRADDFALWQRGFEGGDAGGGAVRAGQVDSLQRFHPVQKLQVLVHHVCVRQVENLQALAVRDLPEGLTIELLRIGEAKFHDIGFRRVGPWKCEIAFVVVVIQYLNDEINLGKIVECWYDDSLLSLGRYRHLGSRFEYTS